MVYLLEIKLGQKFYHYHHPHTLAHLYNQFNHAFAVLISAFHLKCINFYRIGPKIKLLLQKLCSLLWGALTSGLRLPMASGSWQLRSHTPSQALQLQIAGYKLG